MFAEPHFSPSPQLFLDRDANSRDNPGLIAYLLQSSDTRVVFYHDGRIATRNESLALLSIPELSLSASGNELQDLGIVIYLGKSAAHSYLGVCLNDDALAGDVGIEGIGPKAILDFLASELNFTSLRLELARLNGVEKDIAMIMSALGNWHKNQPYCPACGEQSEPSQSGWSRTCKKGGHETFPRTDPAVIMAVFDQNERLLLAQNALWENARYSVLAGFIEAGEDGSSAVKREVAEEVGLMVTSSAFVTTQSWPFPGSLMLAYNAWVSNSEFVIDGKEIAHARWFEAQELHAAAHSGQLQLPGQMSVAWKLIELWLTGQGLSLKPDQPTWL